MIILKIDKVSIPVIVLSQETYTHSYKLGKSMLGTARNFEIGIKRGVRKLRTWG